MLEDIGVLLKYLMHASPGIIICLSCIRYIKEANTLDGKLMLLGSILGLISLTFLTFYYEYFFDFENSIGPTASIITHVNRIFNVIGGLSFTFGFVLAIHKYLQLLKKEDHT